MLLVSINLVNNKDIAVRPVESWGRGRSFLGPRDVWGGAPSLKNNEKGVSDGFFLTSNLHKLPQIVGW